MKHIRYLVVAGLLVGFAAVSVAGPVSISPCEFMLRLDTREIGDCFKEAKSDTFILQQQVRVLSAENRALRGNLCLLAGALKELGSTSSSTALVYEDACAELKAAASKKSATPAKKK